MKGDEEEDEEEMRKAMAEKKKIGPDRHKTKDEKNVPGRASLMAVSPPRCSSAMPSRRVTASWKAVNLAAVFWTRASTSSAVITVSGWDSGDLDSGDLDSGDLDSGDSPLVLSVMIGSFPHRFWPMCENWFAFFAGGDDGR